MQKVIGYVLAFALISISVDGSDHCLESPDPGPCKGNLVRWYFNPSTRKCQEFFYGGCQGNGNNFESETSCLSACADRCSIPLDSGSCKGNFKRWYYDASWKQCKPFTYGGCRGNRNNFETRDECEQSCKNPCNLPLKVGSCKANIARWYYNSNTGKCEMFKYGGCHGNANNFMRKEECQETCLETCDLPVKQGPCRAKFPRWFYNSHSGVCEKFTYGGCRGNKNNFETKKDCRNECINLCKLQPNRGRCKGRFPRWFYNSAHRRCEVFTYGGCGGNSNRFINEFTCALTCSRRISRD